MQWAEISVEADAATVSAAEEILESIGALALTLEDPADNPLFEPQPGETPLWPEVRLRGLFEAGVDRQRVLAALAGVPGGLRPERIRWREVADRDWERAWMDRFRPMRFGKKLWIVPSGMAFPGEPGAIEIRLDPGLAFGTGTHPTTALCLEWLDAHEPDGWRVIDYGCGSGVLGIAAALKGASRICCVDSDPQAVRAAALNAARNGVADRLSAVPPEAFDESGADLLLANILAGPLIELAPRIGRCVRPGGRIVLSGLLETQRAGVESAYRPWCGKARREQREGWQLLDLCRR